MAHNQQRQRGVWLNTDTCPSVGDTPTSSHLGTRTLVPLFPNHAPSWRNMGLLPRWRHSIHAPSWRNMGLLPRWRHSNHAPSWRNMGLLPRWRHPIMPTWRNMGHLPCWGHPIVPSWQTDTCPSAGDHPASNFLCLCWGLPNFFLASFTFTCLAWPTLHSKWIDVAEIFFWAVLYPCAKCSSLGGRDPSHGVQGGLCTQRNWQGYQSTVAHSHPTLSQQVRMP